MKKLTLLGCILFTLNLSGLGCGVNGGWDDEASGGGELLEGFSFDVFDGGSTAISSTNGRVDHTKYGSQWRPTAMNSTPRSCLRFTFSAGKEFSKNVIMLPNCHNDVGTNVPCLRLLGGPSAVARFVIPVVIDSVYGINATRRFLSNVFKKLLKGGVKEFNSPASVSMILRIVRVSAPALGTSKSAVLSLMPSSQGSSSIAKVFSICTPATNNPSAIKITGRYGVYFPAFAFAIPVCSSSASDSGISQNSEVSDFFSLFINEIVIIGKRGKFQFAFNQCTHYKRKTQNPPNELLLHNEGIRPELIQLKGGFRDEGTVSKSNPLCSPAKIRINTRPNGLNANKLTLI